MRKLVIRFNAPATLTFALLALGALLLGQTFGSAVTMKYFCVYRASLADPLTYLRFFTHVLGHADYSHYMSNMLLLLLVGPPLEEKYGWKKMVWFMAATALVTGLVQFIFFPNSALLGASGIVFMMIVLSSFTESRGGGIPITLILVVIFYLGGEIIDGIRNTDSISQLTHVVGGVLGMIFGFLYRGELLNGRGMGCWGAALLCAGGLGNVLERSWRGCVTDYIRFPRLPAGRLQRLVWNLADLMLSAGALLLAAGSISS